MMSLGDEWGVLEKWGVVTKQISQRLLSSYDTTDYSYDSVSYPQRALNSTGSQYVTINLTKGSGAETYMYYKWNTSDIPNNVRIVSVSCMPRGSCNNQTTSNVAIKEFQMCCGTTPKGTPTTINNTNVSTNYTVSGGDWTAQEIADCRLKIHAVRGSVNTNTTYNIRMVLAYLYVTYEYDAYLYTVKVKNKVSGLTVSPPKQDYELGETATLTFSGLSSGFIVLDNDVDVTSQLVASGDDLVYTISNINSGHKIEVI